MHSIKTLEKFTSTEIQQHALFMYILKLVRVNKEIFIFVEKYGKFREFGYFLAVVSII